MTTLFPSDGPPCRYVQALVWFEGRAVEKKLICSICAISLDSVRCIFHLGLLTLFPHLNPLGLGAADQLKAACRLNRERVLD